MKTHSEISVISKLTSILDTTVTCEHILSSDFCYPLQMLINSKNEKICHGDFQDTNSYENSNLYTNSCNKSETICACILDSLNDLDIRKIKIKMDLLLFSMVMCELKISRTFRSNVLSNFYALYQTKTKNLQHHTNMCSMCQKFIWKIHVFVFLYETRKQSVDFSWGKRLQILVNERCELENAMAWLSTLGGAFSALGDTFMDCAEKAGLISLKQFQLALRLGDPITICRCKIYLAMSLLQLGYYGKTKNMVRDLYQFSIGPEGAKDFRIKNMCIAVWNRLKYVLSENKKARSHLTN